MNLRRLASGDNGFPLSRDLRPRMVDPRDLRPLGEATREHSPKQIRKLIRSVRQFGLVYPALVDEAERVIAGGALVLAAIEMGLRQVPVVTITGLSEAQGRMLRLALNRLAEDSRWDRDALRRELSQILEIENDIEIADTGF
jgi:ParB-like chromosome segregation protein Spo0J